MKPRRVPLRFAPFGVIRMKGESGKGDSKGGKLKGETALPVPPAAWNIPRFGGLGANTAPRASGAAGQHMAGTGRRSRTRPGDVQAADREAVAGVAGFAALHAGGEGRHTGRSRERKEAPPGWRWPSPCARIGGAPHERRGGSGPRRPQGQARGAQARSDPADAPRDSGGA